MLHRDLKPSNVLLQRPGAVEGDAEGDHLLSEFQPRITDFSLAWLADGDGPKTRSGVPIGSPPYMAPEQAEGRLKAIGPSTDVYGLGCILYELLTGRPPFGGDSQLDTLKQVTAVDPIPPRRVRKDTSVALDAIALKCLEKDPARRYPTACDLADDLDRFLAGEPTRARPPSRCEKMRRAARRHPAAVVILTLGVLFAGALLGGQPMVREPFERNSTVCSPAGESSPRSRAGCTPGSVCRRHPGAPANSCGIMIQTWRTSFYETDPALETRICVSSPGSC